MSFDNTPHAPRRVDPPHDAHRQFHHHVSQDAFREAMEDVDDSEPDPDLPCPYDTAWEAPWKCTDDAVIEDVRDRANAMGYALTLPRLCNVVTMVTQGYKWGCGAHLY